jgi:hypothetical protein
VRNIDDRLVGSGINNMLIAWNIDHGEWAHMCWMQLGVPLLATKHMFL